MPTHIGRELLTDAFSRVRGAAHEAVAGLSPAQLERRLDEDANSIAWLIWHTARVQDHYASEMTGSPQVWVTGGWSDRFGLPFAPSATGYGQSSAEVAAVKASAELLDGYGAAADEAMAGYLRDLADSELDRVVDDSYDPPVTLAVRLVSIVEDNLLHVGQAAFIRGIVQR